MLLSLPDTLFIPFLQISHAPPSGSAPLLTFLWGPSLTVPMPHCGQELCYMLHRLPQAFPFIPCTWLVTFALICLSPSLVHKLHICFFTPGVWHVFLNERIKAESRSFASWNVPHRRWEGAFPWGQLASSGTGLGWSPAVSVVLCSGACAAAEVVASTHWDRRGHRDEPPASHPSADQVPPLDGPTQPYPWPAPALSKISGGSTPEQHISKPGWPLSLTHSPTALSRHLWAGGGWEVKDVFTLEFVPEGWLQNGLGDPPAGLLLGDFGCSGSGGQVPLQSSLLSLLLLL